MNRLGDVNLRAMITARIKSCDGRDNITWLADVYMHLIKQGVSDDDAMEAVRKFVDDIIDAKMARKQ